MSSTPVLEAKSISKHFGGVTALEDVSFSLGRAEIVALCGENGAGKSTLIKVLSGLHPAGSFSGELRVDGRSAAFAHVRDAERAGIAVIHQELALVPEMTVAENLFLGREPSKSGLLAWNRMFSDARALLAEFSLDLDPAAKVEDLGVGQQQLVEIAKALGKRSRILILDEPTAALNVRETDTLLGIVERLRESGISAVYISHKLDEVFRIADRIVVLRDGRSVADMRRSETDVRSVIRQMVGREINELFPRRASQASKVMLKVESLSVACAGHFGLERIGFEVRAGEVLGIGGLMGAGRSELLLHLMGAFGTRTEGRVELEGRPFQPKNPEQAIARGVVLVSEDRKRYGLCLDQSVNFNLSLSSLERVTRRGLIDHDVEHAQNRKLSEQLSIRLPTLEAPVSSLSGGNQQKVVLGKAWATAPRVVLLDEPTRGIDVGAKLEVYELINRLTGDGKAVVLVSSELAELQGMSDRILMLSRGTLGGTFDARSASQEELLVAAMGKPDVSNARTRAPSAEDVS
jgi:D-xylose transport system ATP-binding protein